MDHYIVLLGIIGVAALAMAWLPDTFSNLPISYPVVFIAFGALLSLLPIGLPEVNIYKDNEIMIRMSELSVIISLMGTGVKIDTPFNLKNWSIPIRLVTVTMLLCIAGVTAAGMYWLSLPLASALLLGAVLAPTDPVLASDVQVGPPNEPNEHKVRFALTAEAGLNDGMAFPFTWLAILIVHQATTVSLSGWALEFVLLKLGIGIASGFLLGKAISFLIFHAPKRWKFPEIKDGFVGLSATLFVYAVTEMIHGYGFLAVFVAALTIGSTQREHTYHRKLYYFIDQTERLVMVLMLIPLGTSIAHGLFDHIGWPELLLSLTFLLVIRPLAGLAGMLGISLPVKEKMIIGFMGIRGIGTIYYLAFAFSQGDFEYKEKLWAISALIILISVIVHGISATPLMKHLEAAAYKENDSK